MRENKTIIRIREFNQFYLPALDLLGNHYLGSEYNATEARVLYEVHRKDGCNASHIAKTMNIDKSYLSRIIKRHEKNGYVIKTVSEQDSRSFDLHLTEKGRERAEDFIHKSNRQIEEMIRPLREKECEALIYALDTATDILRKCNIAKG